MTFYFFCYFILGVVLMPLGIVERQGRFEGPAALPVWGLKHPSLFWLVTIIVGFGYMFALIIAFYNFGFLWGVVSFFETLLGFGIARVFISHHSWFFGLLLAASPIVTLYILGLLLGVWYL
jgi:hypothetical protein